MHWPTVKEVLKRPVGPLIGMCGQFLFMPLVSAGITVSGTGQKRLISAFSDRFRLWCKISENDFQRFSQSRTVVCRINRFRSYCVDLKLVPTCSSGFCINKCDYFYGSDSMHQKSIYWTGRLLILSIVEWNFASWRHYFIIKNKGPKRKNHNYDFVIQNIILITLKICRK